MRVEELNHRIKRQEARASFVPGKMLLAMICEHGRRFMEKESVPEHWVGRRVLVMLDIRTVLEEFAASLESVSSYGVALRYPYPFDTSEETIVFYPWRLVRHIRLEEKGM